ncbi:MAG: ABC transporter permease [Chloroflexia bacterium]|nr:ABC transporter permease [Chloroflexia bacterium]
MLGFVIRRFLRGVITLWLVVTVVFFGLRISGDPVTLMLGFEASPEAIERMREKLGLNDGVGVQYLRYLQLIGQGDFGDSIREPRPVTQVVFDRLPATLELALAAILIAVVVGIPVGVVAALHRNSLIDRGLMSFAFLGQSAPNFFVGILLILCFSLWLQVLPSAGRGGWQHLIMPALTLSTYGMASLARLTRSSILEVLGADYVRTARAKGLRESRVLAGHILRNAALPIVTIFGLQVGLAISGAVITETVFAWPGMGRLAANAVFRRDYPVIQFIVLLIAASVVIVNFAIDIFYGLIDPRIRQRA